MIDFLSKCMVRASIGALISLAVASASAVCQGTATKRDPADKQDASVNSRHYPMVIGFSGDGDPVEEEVRDNVPRPPLTGIDQTNMSAIAQLGAGGASSVAAQSPTDREVLNVDEASALLRVDRGIVVQLAESDAIPARRVGNDWRFRRSALLVWLEGNESAKKPEHASRATIDDLPSVENRQNELRNVSGRGTNEQPRVATEPPSKESRPEEANNPTPDPPANAPPTSNIGERPTTPTSEDIALRDQRVLLPRGAGTIDLGFAYGHSSQTLLPVIRVEQSDFYANSTVRFGIMNDVQLTLRAPAVWRNTKTFVDPSVTGSKLPSTFNLPDNMAQGASVSVLGVGWRESVRRPTMIWSFDSTLPLGPGDRGMGGGMVLSKSYDPAVLFAGFTYLYGQRINASDPNSYLGKNNFGAQFGYTYAINDTLALSTAVFATYRDTRSPEGTSIPPPRENYALQLGTTWLVAKGLFVEPAVAMQLGGDNPGLTVLLNFSRSFASPRTK